MERTQPEAAEPLASTASVRPRLNRSTALIGAGLIATFALVNLAMNRAESAPGAKEAKIGLRISPVPMKTNKKNKTLVGLGSYIVNAQSACADCHTSGLYQEGGDPHQGQPMQINTENFLAGGQTFGPFVSTNLTPDENGLPGGLTFHEFDSLMRTGRHPEGHEHFRPEHSGPILQVMPWPAYKNMTSQDMKAIYAYLSSIPHADPPAAE
ncbi:MAG: cytochrome C [Armatimonadota bacterium]